MELTLDQYWLTFVISTALPMLTALITKRYGSAAWSAWILLALSAITGTLTSIEAAGGTFILEAAISGTVVSFITAVGVHFGLLKPAHVTGNDGVIRKTVEGGVGGKRQPKHRADI